jgi:hypothetical protein
MPSLPPRWRGLLFPALALALMFGAWRSYGGQGLLLATLMISFWVLLHFTQLLRVLRIAANRPMGQVADLTPLLRRLRLGQSLSDVVRLTRSLGLRVNAPEEAVNVLSWSDEAGHTLIATFVHGRLSAFEHRPPEHPPAQS